MEQRNWSYAGDLIEFYETQDGYLVGHARGCNGEWYCAGRNSDVLYVAARLVTFGDYDDINVDRYGISHQESTAILTAKIREAEWQVGHWQETLDECEFCSELRGAGANVLTCLSHRRIPAALANAELKLSELKGTSGVGWPD